MYGIWLEGQAYVTKYNVTLHRKRYMFEVLICDAFWGYYELEVANRD